MIWSVLKVRGLSMENTLYLRKSFNTPSIRTLGVDATSPTIFPLFLGVSEIFFWNLVMHLRVRFGIIYGVVLVSFQCTFNPRNFERSLSCMAAGEASFNLSRSKLLDSE